MQKKSFEDKLEDTKIGMCAMGKFHDAGYDVNVLMNDSQNFTIDFNYED